MTDGSNRSLTRGQAMAMFLFVVFTFLVLSLFMGHVAHNLRDYQRAQCARSFINVNKLNLQLDEMTRIDAMDPNISPASKSARLRLYLNSRLVVPVCR